jgi:hypothetical protein
MGYITLFLKEIKGGWNISSKYLLYFATAETVIIVGLLIGFPTTLGYIYFSLVILVCFLPFFHVLIEKLRNNRKRRNLKLNPDVKDEN